MATPAIPKSGSGKLMRQGQTASGLFADDPNAKGIPGVEEEPKELKK
jgi:hypothetical protein